MGPGEASRKGGNGVGPWGRGGIDQGDSWVSSWTFSTWAKGTIYNMGRVFVFLCVWVHMSLTKQLKMKILLLSKFEFKS